jgi:hypothetical protein
VERPSDPAVRKANLRRIIVLFRPYRARLSVVLTLIFFSAAIGVVSPFLLRQVLDVAIPEDDMRLLSLLVAGMVAIPVVTGVIGIYQTLLSHPPNVKRCLNLVPSTRCANSSPASPRASVSRLPVRCSSLHLTPTFPYRRAGSRTVRTQAAGM